jgi:hypothetical protein
MSKRLILPQRRTDPAVASLVEAQEAAEVRAFERLALGPR